MSTPHPLKAPLTHTHTPSAAPAYSSKCVCVYIMCVRDSLHHLLLYMVILEQCGGWPCTPCPPLSRTGAVGRSTWFTSHLGCWEEFQHQQIGSVLLYKFMLNSPFDLILIRSQTGPNHQTVNFKHTHTHLRLPEWGNSAVYCYFIFEHKYLRSLVMPGFNLQ